MTEKDDLLLEVEECTELNDKLATLLRRVALALKGKPEPLSRHSFHDLPELVAALKLERDQLKQAMRLPALFTVEPYQTIDRGSLNYKSGFNAGVRSTAALNNQGEKPDA